MSNAVKNFEIILEHDIDDQYQYEPGELMKGRVDLDAADNIRVKSILVQVKGEATVSWQQNEGGKSAEAFSTNETYVDEIFTVFGIDDDGPRSMEVTRGEHSYPFAYPLPDTLPSSFIGKHGSVTYIVKATLKRDQSGGLGTSITTQPFLMLRPLDLRAHPELQQTRTAVASRRTAGFSPLCCLFGKTEGRFSVNRTGFLPGDDMVVDAEISNDSVKPVKSIQAALVLVCTFQAQKLTRTHTQVVLKKADNAEVDFEEKRKWSGVRMSVPSYVPESRLDGCDMIIITYELRFRLEMADGSDVTAAIPITVGTPKRRNTAAAAASVVVPASNGSVRMTGNGNGSVARRPPKGTMGSGADDEGDDDDGKDIASDLEKFRHPMVPGETRQNMLYDGNID